jgi:hypothetical protein
MRFITLKIKQDKIFKVTEHSEISKERRLRRNGYGYAILSGGATRAPINSFYIPL